MAVPTAPPPPPPPPHAVSAISKSPGKVKQKTSRRVVFTCHPFLKRQLLISRLSPVRPYRVGQSVGFPVVYTRDPQGIKPRRIIKCGATYRTRRSMADSAIDPPTPNR